VKLDFILSTAPVVEYNLFIGLFSKALAEMLAELRMHAKGIGS
jgi:hypothetical protein